MTRVPLTDEQIESILAEVPEPPGAGKTAVRLARQQLVQRLRDYLEESITLPPIEAAFQEFKNQTIEAIYLSFIEPGTPIGVLSGTALSGPLTQMTMKTFHFAGQQSGFASAFNQVRDFLTGSKVNRNPSMRIFLKDPTTGTDLHDVLHVGTPSSIYAMRADLEETTVRDCVSGIPQTINHDEAIAEGVDDLVNLFRQIRPDRFRGKDNIAHFPLTHVLVLGLNTYRMFTHRITMEQLAVAIEGPLPVDVVVCVWKSQFDEKMYVLLDESRDYNMKAINRQSAILMFFEQTIVPSLDKWTVKGIRGVLSIEPQEVRVTEAIDRVQVIVNGSRNNPSRVSGENQVVVISQKKTRVEGPSLYDVVRLLQNAEFPVTQIDRNNLEIFVNFSGDLIAELNRRIQTADPKTPEGKRLLESASFAYIVTNGLNFEPILWRDDVDLYRSYPVNSHEIVEYLGLECARAFLFEEFTRTLTNFGESINVRHTALIFDLFTHLGSINSMSSSGVNRRALGPMAAATQQRAMDVFANSSIMGDRQAIAGISPAMYVGQQSTQIGTGTVGTVDDETIQPSDRPALPPGDQIIEGDVVIDEIGGIFEGTQMAETVAETEIELERSVNKAEIREWAPILTVPPSSGGTDILIPPGGQNVPINSTLMKALAKVTTGSNVEFVDGSQEIPDITEIELTGLEIVPEVRGQPSVPTNVLDQLQAVPGATLPGPIEEPLPVVSVSEIPTHTPIQPAVSEPRGRILDIPPPEPIPPPALPIPRSPRSIVVAPTVPLPANTTFDFASFIASLPREEVPTGPREQNIVRPIDVNAFLSFVRK